MNPTTVTPIRHEGRRADDSSARWVCFELAGQLYGLEILKVQEVLASADIESVPGAPLQILGISNLRGSIVTILDLRRRLGLPGSEIAEVNCVVVVDGHGEPVGLRVDRVIDVRSIARQAVKAPPATGSLTSGVLGVVTRGQEVLTLLDATVMVAPLVAQSAMAA